MFNKLRNKLILINLSITSFVILVIFSTIYIVSTKSAENRPPRIQDFPDKSIMTDDDSDGVPDEFEDVVNFMVRQEKKSAAENLLITLIVSGIAIELAVALVSYFLAEEAIKPVREAYEAQKVFIANASHEIKTPLAAISANLEAANITNNKWVKNVEIETEKLADLNSNLLTLAKTDLAQDFNVVEVDLKSVVDKLLDGFESRLKNKKLVKKINLEAKVKINLTDFEQIFSILVDNAIKYSDKKIVLNLDRHKLEVKNDGAKIPKENLNHVFDRFYQVDKSSDGVGLGLSIAKSLADRNNYKLSAKSDEQKSDELVTFMLEF